MVIEAIVKSKERTLAIVKYIDRMFEVYRVLTNDSGKPEEVRRYNTIKELYLSDNKKTVEEVSDCHKIDTRTVYRDVKEAVKTLSSLMFGVDSIRFDD